MSLRNRLSVNQLNEPVKKKGVFGYREPLGGIHHTEKLLRSLNLAKSYANCTLRNGKTP